MSKIVLDIQDVSMKFNLSRERIDNLKEYLVKFGKKKRKSDDFYALNNINLQINQGDRVGILGFNGAGKSTLLKVICGVFRPTTGKVVRNGKIIPLLELGAGFDQQYTGAENIYLYGAVLGYSKAFLKSKFDEIVEFSELAEFIDVPIKNYSSGMKVRLGFSIATIVKPEILILDEVLSVGDAKFRKKSLAKVNSMMADNVTVLFVSHSLEQIKSVCNKAIILEKGSIIASGEVQEMCKLYQELSDAPKR